MVAAAHSTSSGTASTAGTAFPESHWGFRPGSGTVWGTRLAVAALIVAVVALLLVAFGLHAWTGTQTAGARGASGPAGAPGKDGTNGVNGTQGLPGPNLSYVAFTAAFTLSVTPTSQVGSDSVVLTLDRCSSPGNGLHACYLWFNWTAGPPHPNATAKIVGLSYPPTDAFYYLGANPKIGTIFAPTMFQLWFGTTLSATTDVTTSIQVFASVR